MQDPKPKPSITVGLKKFYGQYEKSGNIPTDEQLNSMATEFAGREAELWGDLIRNYTGSEAPREHLDKLVEGFENPFLDSSKKKVPVRPLRKQHPMVAVLALPPLRIQHPYWKAA